MNNEDLTDSSIAQLVRCVSDLPFVDRNVAHRISVLSREIGSGYFGISHTYDILFKEVRLFETNRRVRSEFKPEIIKKALQLENLLEKAYNCKRKQKDRLENYLQSFNTP